MKIYAYVFLIFCILGMSIEYCAKQQSRKATFIWWTNNLSHDKNTKWYQHLQSQFKRYGYHLEHQKKHPPQNSDIVIWAYPQGNLSGISDKQYLVGWLLESPISLTQPLDKKKAQKFDLILTYRTDLVDNKKSFFIRIFTRVHDIKKEYWQTPKSVLVSQIASCLSGGLYEERKVATKWFLENAPQDFKLYGDGWDKFKKNLSQKAQKSFKQQYGGYIDNKIQVISESKFVLAYENASQNDYVTEKIYDVLQAGSIPIYLGASNIDQYVPKECYINKNDFKTYEDLYSFLKKMDDRTYEGYRACAYNFVQRPELKELSIINSVVHHVFDKKEKDFFDLWNKFWVDIANFLIKFFERKYI